MPQNYTKMWDAFLGGEWATGESLTETATSQDYLDQTKAFYSNILDPAFDLPGFGTTSLEGAYAAFSNVDLETAERTFRSEIGDPYGATYGDPFSWEKVSRYNTEDPAGIGRLQDLLEDQLYGQGKFLGGQTGADYGIATSKGVEEYSTGMRGEREALTYEGLTSGVSLASGTSGATIRSGASMGVAEDVLIEAYKKAKTLGTDYRAGTEGIEQTLSEDLDTALTTYLEAIDEEKDRWFQAVLSNVQTFKTLEMEDDLAEGATHPYQTMTDEELEAEMDLTGGDFYNEWSCGYGQIWDATLNGGEGGCVDTEAYGTEVAGAKFRDDPACGIGELYNETTGECEVRDDLGLEKDDYGYLFEEGEIDECGEPNGPGQTESCWDGSMACPGACPEDTRVTDCAGELGGSAEVDECGECGGDGASIQCYDGSFVCNSSECLDEEPQCPQGQIPTASGDCIPDPDLPCTLECPEGQELNPSACVCYDIWDYDYPGKEFS